MGTANKIIIAIDGFSSCGKSTLAKDLAEKLGYTYIDSGAMYRAVTLFAIKNNYVLGKLINENALIKRLTEIDISFRVGEDGNRITMLNNENVEKEIRRPEVSKIVSTVSQIKSIRRHLVAIQQRLGEEKGVVMDGRDIGTVVYPNAELKFFVTADPKIRAKRRWDELKQNGVDVSFDDVFENIKERDFLDTSRSTDPLRKAEGAIELDNTNLDRVEQLAMAMLHFKELQLV